MTFDDVINLASLIWALSCGFKKKKSSSYASGIHIQHKAIKMEATFNFGRGHPPLLHPKTKRLSHMQIGNILMRDHITNAKWVWSYHLSRWWKQISCDNFSTNISTLKQGWF